MKYCQNCGAQLKDRANFCPECGTRAAAVPAFEEERPKSGALKIVLIILAVLAVLAIAVGTLFFLLSYKSAPAADIMPPVEVTESAAPAEEEQPEAVQPAEVPTESTVTEEAPETAEAPAESTVTEEAPETAEVPTEVPAEAPVPAGPLYSGTPDEQFEAVQRGMFNAEAVSPFIAAAGNEGPQIDTDLKVRFKVKDAPVIINSSTANISVRVDREGTSVIDVNFKMGGFLGISGLLTYGDDTLGLMLFDKYYTVTLEELVKMIADEAGVSPAEIELAAGSRIDSAAAAEEIRGIADILYKLAGPENTVRKDGSVKFEYVNGSAECTTLSCTPTAKQIKAVIMELCDYLQGSEIMKMLEENSDFSEALADVRRRSGELAHQLAENNFTWSVSCDDSHVYEISIGPEGEEIVFQNLTGEECGITVLAVRGSSGEQLFKNEYAVSGGRVTGSFETDEMHIDYDLSLIRSSGLGIPYGDVTVAIDGSTLSFNTRAGGKVGSVHTLSFCTEEEGELFTVSIESSDKPASVELPDIPATEVNSENLDEVLGNLESILEMLG